jgi:flagellar basal body-associated protein FliL
MHCFVFFIFPLGTLPKKWKNNIIIIIIIIIIIFPGTVVHNTLFIFRISSNEKARFLSNRYIN